MGNDYKNFDLKQCDLVHVTWLDAFDALGTGWHEWDDIEKKAVLAKCTSVGYLFKEDDEKIVLVGDETGEFGSRITVIPKSWQLDIRYLKKPK